MIPPRNHDEQLGVIRRKNQLKSVRGVMRPARMATAARPERMLDAVV
jgi:hypothetical protein